MFGEVFMQTVVVRNQSAIDTGKGLRDYSLDNIRFFLIFLVIFGHLAEVCSPFAGSKLIFKLIYSFHMPAFVFLFGYNAKFSPQKILCRWCVPYFAFQVLYVLFVKFIAKETVDLQFTTPYWLLWYLLACMFYQLLLPLYDTSNKRRQVFTLLTVYVISLLIGFDDSVGYYMSLSRFFVFQPWFLLGYYCKKNDAFDSESARDRKSVIAVLLSIVIIILSIPFFYFTGLPNRLLFGSFSYAACSGTLWERMAVSVIALSWIVFLFAGIKPRLNRRLACITNIGQNTWPIYLLHGFIIKIAPICCAELLDSPWLVLLLTCGIVLIFGNRIFHKICYYIGFTWIEKFIANDS